MNIVFMGTPAFAVEIFLQLLTHNYAIVAVITQPDRPKGRKKTWISPPMKLAAIAQGIPVFQPERLRDPASIALVKELNPDMIITAAYGQILPKAILELPRLGCLNVHGSLLPRYRGGAPIQHAIINGEKHTGITIMYMAESLDSGDIISQQSVNIDAEDTTGSMFDKLSVIGGTLLLQTLPRLISGQVVATPQNEQEVTYAPNLTRADEYIQWAHSAQEIFNRVRGLYPFPGAYTEWNEQGLKIWECRVGNQADELIKSSKDKQAVPGTVIGYTADGIAIQTGQGFIVVTKLQPAGKKAMPAVDWVRGNPLSLGTILGEKR